MYYGVLSNIRQGELAKKEEDRAKQIAEETQGV
jgi:hypothetical protein